MIIQKIKSVLLTALLVFGVPLLSQAEDIDLYSGLGSTSGAPNVLFVIDNASNFNASSGGLPCMRQADGSLVLGGTSGTETAIGATVGGIEQCALWNVIKNLPVGKSGEALVNIGFMMYNGSHMTDYPTRTFCGGGPSAVSSDAGLGGCLVMPLTAMTEANKTSFLPWVASWVSDNSTNDGTNTQAAGKATAAVMQEAWAYYAGKTGLSTRNYSGVAAGQGCQKNFIIYIGNSFNSSGSPGDSSSGGPLAALNTAIDAQAKPSGLDVSDAEWAAAKAIWKTPILNAVPTACTSNPSTWDFATPSSHHTENGGHYADEWARFMYGADLDATKDDVQSISTYTVGLLNPASCNSEYAALLDNMAGKAGGKYFATTSYTEIVQAVLKILNEVQSVNSVFASSSLPVSVNAQGTYLNQIFMGMFRPDQNAYPRWQGNLKQYQFKCVATTTMVNGVAKIDTCGSLTLADQNNSAALNASGTKTGFLSANAISFWTCGNLGYTGTNPASTCSPVADPTGGFWVNQASGAGGAFDLPDGPLVEKGGAAQQLRLANLTAAYSARPYSPRRLYTYLGSPCATCSLIADANAFDPGNYSSSAISDTLLKTGPATITSITSASQLSTSSTIPGTTGTPDTITITGFSKSGSTVTATASVTDLAKLSVGSQLKIATGATRYDCDPCTITAITSSGFTYSNSGGSGLFSGSYTAQLYTAFVIVTSAANPSVGTSLTIKNCSVYTDLNSTIGTITASTASNFTVAVTASIVGAAADAGCTYNPNTASVTTSAAHGFPQGATVVISGTSGSTTSPYTGFNGSWIVTVTGGTTFTYQYTALAPLASFSGSGTATSSSTTGTQLINWVRGQDNYGDEDGPGGSVTVRPSIHGDVLHSRPVVINYGGSTGIIVFYGSNDGVFHAVNGNQATAISSGGQTTQPGGELWGFIPKEFLGQLKRLHDNSPQLKMPSTPSGILPEPQTKDYFVDGPTGLYQEIDADGTTTKAVIYLAMRRGGSLLYAIDVTTPAAPKVLWKKSNSDIPELGQTWSQTKVARIKGHTNPVLIFGGGYDPAEDSRPPAGVNSDGAGVSAGSASITKGRGIFVLDAVDGTLVWAAENTTHTINSVDTVAVSGMNYSIPADITLVDSDYDGYIDRLYAVDLGGNIWRVNLEAAAGNAPADWVVKQLASFSGRKFFYPVEIIPTSSYNLIAVGSGNREDPLGKLFPTNTYEQNRFYVIKDDTDVTGRTVITESDPPSGTDLTPKNSGLVARTLATSTAYVDDNVHRGYYITLNNNERVVNAPLAVAGIVYFGTNQPDTSPSNNSCSAGLGIAKGYQLDPFNGLYTSTIFDGGGLPPSAVGGLVNVTATDGTTRQVPFVIGGGNGDPTCTGPDCTSAIGSGKPSINVSHRRSRMYWYQAH